MQPRTEITRFTEIPNVGPATEADLVLLGFTTPLELVGQNPVELYNRLIEVTATRQDPCVLDVFIAAVRYMEGGPKRMWWSFTKERKSLLAKRNT